MKMKVKDINMKEQIEKYKELQIILKKHTYKNFPYTNDFKNEKYFINKLTDIYNELKSFGMTVSIYDPHANSDEVYKEFGIKMDSSINQYDVIILTVPHDEFLKLDLNALKNQKESVVYDLKSVLDINQVDARL